MKKRILSFGLLALFSAFNSEAKPGGSYTLTGTEKGISEIVLADMKKYPEMYQGETLDGYVDKFKRENRIGKRKLSKGDKLHLPETMASIKARKQRDEARKVALSKNLRSSKNINGSITEVKSEIKPWKTKSRGTYTSRTFEVSYKIGPCGRYFITEHFEFMDKKGNVTFMKSNTYVPVKSTESRENSTCLHIDADEHKIRNAKLVAYCVQLHDEDGSLIVEECVGCESLDELMERNPKPKGV